MGAAGHRRAADVNLGVELDGVAWMLALLLHRLGFPLVSALSVSPSSTAVSSSISMRAIDRGRRVRLLAPRRPAGVDVHSRAARRASAAPRDGRPVAAPRGWRAARCDRTPADRATRSLRPRSVQSFGVRVQRLVVDTVSRASSMSPRPTRTRIDGMIAALPARRSHDRTSSGCTSATRAAARCRSRTDGSLRKAIEHDRRRRACADAPSASSVTKTSAALMGRSRARRRAHRALHPPLLRRVERRRRRRHRRRPYARARRRQCAADERVALRPIAGGESRAASMLSPTGVRPSGQMQLAEEQRVEAAARGPGRPARRPL